MFAKKILPVVVVIGGLATLYPLQRWIDRHTPREVVSEEALYFSSGETLKRMSVGLEGLAADVYWIRTLQYFGRKLMSSGLPFSSAMTQNIRMDLLAPLLNIVVTLDPHHIPAYRFGAIFLPERDLPAAVSLLERGIEQNPDEWHLYQDLGYIYWQAKEYEKAAQWYERGSKIPGARWWMKDLVGIMQIKGGTREAARAVYLGYLSSEEKHIRTQAEERLKQLRVLDEIDVINDVLKNYEERFGSCPASLGVLGPGLYRLGLTIGPDGQPVDPDGFDYALDKAKCVVGLDPVSTIAR
jgi:tetratricopeptide (TPR) repeat protein